MEAVFYSIAVLLSATMIATFVVNFKDYEYYRSRYDMLVSGELKFIYEHGGLYYFNMSGKFNRSLFNRDEVIFFSDTGDVKLAEDHYIHNNIFLHFDFWASKWHKKYMAWFKANKAEFDEINKDKLSNLLKN
jgi:hypothetical protein